MDKSKKRTRVKRMSEALSDAQYRLDRAVVRGEPAETIDQLRAERDQVIQKENG